MNVKKVNHKEYLKKFNQISNIIDPGLLFKVDPALDNKLTTYYICNKGAGAVTRISWNTIELKGLIAYSGGGSSIVKHIIKEYNARYNIILDSFISNHKFYSKHGFKVYKAAAYNPVYDPAGLNKNHEGVLYYKLAAAV